MGIDMGIGLLGDSNIIFKRKFRWTFRVEGICGNQQVPDSFVKLASRPNLSIEETELNYLNAKTWIPGKASWETITVTYIDVAAASATKAPVRGGQPINLYNWLASVYNFTDPDGLYMGPFRAAYAGKGIITMYDGSGASLEQWDLNDLWPTAVNFGDLDYSSSDTVDIELTLRYSSVKYTSLSIRCNGPQITPCPQQCGSVGSTR